MDFTPGEELQFVVFKLGDEEYGIPITQVKEIIRLTTPTKIPKSPAFIEGVINLRGEIMPIVDLKKRFELELSEYDSDARIIVVEISDHICGITVDAVSEVLRISTSSIEPPPGMMANIDVEYIAGVGKVEDRLLIILDIDKLFNDDEQQALKQVKIQQEA